MKLLIFSLIVVLIDEKVEGAGENVNTWKWMSKQLCFVKGTRKHVLRITFANSEMKVNISQQKLCWPFSTVNHSFS